MVGASLLAFNEQDQLLMIERTDNKCWGIPGGAMELGETIEETVKRETLEEIGVQIKNLQLLGIFSGKELYYRYPDGSEVYNVSVVYITHLLDEQIMLDPREHSKLKYFDIEDLPPNISPPINPILKDIQKEGSLKGFKKTI